MWMKLLRNQRGDLAISILIAILAVISGLTLSLVASRDATSTLMSLDSTQELHWLRSEVSRGIRTNQEYTGSADQYILPIKKVQVNHGFATTTYAMKTQLGRYTTSSGLNLANKRIIRSKIKGFRSTPSYTSYYGTENKSPIEKYGERVLQQETFAGYMYLTNTDESVNEDPVYFYGNDELWGRVHSNTDIWLKNLSGWPVFHDHVSTAGHMQYFGGTPDEDEVYLDGYTEEAGWIEFNPTADLLRQNAMKPFGDAESDTHEIVYVEIDGTIYNVMFGDIHEKSYPPQPETLYVYNNYPPFGAVGDSLGYNVITFVDTTWVYGNSGNIPSGTSVFCYDTLWLKGSVYGAQTWGCAKDIYLVDDIIYANTDPGEAPDGDNGDPLNTVDYLGIVSEKRIFIQYGIRDMMADSLRHHYNCEDIYIYGALCALGDGEGEPHEDGQFTFEYQYTHFSTPNVLAGNEVFTYPDLHLCWYPPTVSPFWPTPVNRGLYAAFTGDQRPPDYPWYNPLWPETQPIRLRGTIHLFGGLSQVRRGHVRRSGSDVLDTADYWNMDNYVYGRYAWGRETINGALGTGATGYDKAYHYDYRFMENPPPDFPAVNIRGKAGQFQHVAMKIKRPPSGF